MSELVAGLMLIAALLFLWLQIRMGRRIERRLKERSKTNDA